MAHDSKRKPGAGRPKAIPGELARTSIYLPRDLMRRVDATAGQGRRSEWIREALEQRLDREAT